MADKIDMIPDQTKWTVATQGLTGAYIALSNAFVQAQGQEKFDEFNGAFWYEVGKNTKPFADGLGLATDGAADIETASHLMANVSMGPELKFQVVESSKDKCVSTTTEWPWHKRWKEQGLSVDTCSAGHQQYGAGAVASMNPDFTFKLLKNMVRGDSHCEWVIERKK